MARNSGYPGKKGGYGHGDLLPSLGRRGGSTVGPSAAHAGGATRVVGMHSGDLKRVFGAAAGRKSHHARPSRGTSRAR